MADDMLERLADDMMEHPHSSTYYRVYNETYNQHMNQFYRPFSSLPTAEVNHYNARTAEVAHNLASNAAFRAELDEKHPTWLSSGSGGGSYTQTTPTGSSTSPMPATGTARTELYTPGSGWAYGTPYPTARAPTERDLRNQFYYNQRHYNRNL